MFTPIHLLPQLDSAEWRKYTSRWQTQEGYKLQEEITKMIQNGAGEDFLQGEFEQGRLGFLEDMWDLKGIDLSIGDVTFPNGDSFEAISFSHAKMWHSTFRNAVFSQCGLRFMKIFQCVFERCIFSFDNFYGVRLENVKFIDCDFYEENSFINCEFSNTSFANCFVPTRLFSDCSFDERTVFGELVRKPYRMSDYITLRNEELAGLYGGIKAAYASGGVKQLSRRYYFRQMQAFTRYNASSILDKVSGYFWEFIAGYGVRPLRVLMVMALAFAAVFACFSREVDLSDAAILTAGALFTFGAKAELLDQMCGIYQIIYVLTSFFGISLAALFVTVLANMWLRDQ